MKTTALRLPGLLSLLLLLSLGLQPAQAQTVTIAPNGSADYRTIQEAINSLPDLAAKLRTVLIKNGTYHEKIYLDGKEKLVLKGQSESGVVLTYAQARDLWTCDPNATAGDWGVATLNLRNSPDITLENLSVINSYGFAAVARAGLLDSKHQNDATIDNDATTREINYLAEAFQKTHNPAYRQGVENGIRYLLKMQYANGGFPQFYPDLSSYHGEIIYNDDAMIRALTVLRQVARQQVPFAALDPELVLLAQAAVARGVASILRMQYVSHGQPTAWAAQYDPVSLLPAKARAFELPSLSGEEPVSIVRFLMDIEQPTAAEKAAIEGAVQMVRKNENTQRSAKGDCCAKRAQRPRPHHRARARGRALGPFLRAGHQPAHLCGPRQPGALSAHRNRKRAPRRLPLRRHLAR
nr:pectate lyase [Hymenobacter siberiensis]